MSASKRKSRLGLWIAAVAGALAFHGIASRYSFAIVLICLLGILGLLCTTPADAIRLPRWISEIFIFTASATMSASRSAAAIAIHLLILLMMLILLRLWRKSPWWAVPYAWFPIH